MKVTEMTKEMEYLLKLKRARLILAFKKYRQYKRITIKLDYFIEICVIAKQWDLARNTYHRLERVKKIWKGEK